MLCPKNFQVKKSLGSQIFFCLIVGLTNIWSKKILGEKMLCPRILSLKKCLVQKLVGQIKFLSEKLWVQKSLSPKNDLGFRSENF